MDNEKRILESLFDQIEELNDDVAIYDYLMQWSENRQSYANVRGLFEQLCTSLQKGKRKNMPMSNLHCALIMSQRQDNIFDTQMEDFPELNGGYYQPPAPPPSYQAPPPPYQFPQYYPAQNQVYTAPPPAHLIPGFQSVTQSVTQSIDQSVPGNQPVVNRSVPPSATPLVPPLGPPSAPPSANPPTNSFLRNVSQTSTPSLSTSGKSDWQTKIMNISLPDAGF